MLTAKVHHLNLSSFSLEDGEIALNLNHRSHRDILVFEALCNITGISPDSTQGQRLWNAEAIQLVAATGLNKELVDEIHHNALDRFPELIESAQALGFLDFGGIFSKVDNDKIYDLAVCGDFLKNGSIELEAYLLEKSICFTMLSNGATKTIELSPEIFKEATDLGIPLNQQWAISFVLASLLDEPPFYLKANYNMEAA